MYRYGFVVILVNLTFQLIITPLLAICGFGGSLKNMMNLGGIIRVVLQSPASS